MQSDSWWSPLWKKSQILTWVAHPHTEDTRKEGGTRTYGIYPVWATSNSSMSWLWSPKSMSVHLLITVKEEDSLITADIGYQQINTPQSAGGGEGIRVLAQRLQDATAVQTLQKFGCRRVPGPDSCSDSSTRSRTNTAKQETTTWYHYQWPIAFLYPPKKAHHEWVTDLIYSGQQRKLYGKIWHKSLLVLPLSYIDL